MTKKGDCYICHDENQENYYPGKKTICKKHHSEKVNSQKNTGINPDDILSIIDSKIEEAVLPLKDEINAQNREISSLKDKIIELLAQNTELSEKLSKYQEQVRDSVYNQNVNEQYIYKQIDEVNSEVDYIKEKCCTPKTNYSLSPRILYSDEDKITIQQYISQLREIDYTKDDMEKIANYYNIKFISTQKRWQKPKIVEYLTNELQKLIDA